MNKNYYVCIVGLLLAINTVSGIVDTSKKTKPVTQVAADKTDEELKTLIRKYLVEQTDIFSSVFEQSKNAVVQVLNYSNTYNVLQPYNPVESQQQSAGSGFFINDAGEIITNYHVVRESVALFIQMPQCGREQFEVEFVGACPSLDVALLRLTDDSRDRLKGKFSITKLPFLSFGNSNELTSAQLIMAVGYPLGGADIKSSCGEIAGRSDAYLQITAPINPGNSGGPVFDKDGYVVGVAVAKIASESVDCVGYMIPIERVKIILEELHKAKIVQYPYWGFNAAPTTPETRSFLGADVDGGLYIEKIKKGSLVENAGFEPGDIMYNIDGYDLDQYGYIDSPWKKGEKAFISEYLQRRPFGHSVELKAYRNGKPFTKKITVKNERSFAINYIHPWIEELPDYEIVGGMVVMDLTMNHLEALELYALMYDLSDVMKYGKEENRYQGRVLITEVFPNSPVHMARAIHAGSIVAQVNGIAIDTVNDFRDALLQADDGVITIKTETGSFAAFALSDIVASEPKLAKIYNYDLPALYYKLLAL